MSEALLNSAILFAVDAHSGSMRKGTNLPYIVHPLETLSVVSSMTDDLEILAAAVLHDILEDTPTTKEQLHVKFGERVANLVSADSEDKQADKPKSDTWKQRKQETIDVLKAEKDIAVKMIVLGDKLSNLRSMHSDYEKIGDELWKRFNEKDKKEHAWYYREIFDALDELSDFTAYKEYKVILQTLFEV